MENERKEWDGTTVFPDSPVGNFIKAMPPDKLIEFVVGVTKKLPDEAMRELILSLQKALSNR